MKPRAGSLKTDKPLLIKKKREKGQINKIRHEREVRTDNTEIQKSIRKYNEQLCTNKLDKLKEIDKFLETYNLQRLNQEETKSQQKDNYQGNQVSNQKTLSIQKS